MDLLSNMYTNPVCYSTNVNPVCYSANHPPPPLHTHTPQSCSGGSLPTAKLNGVHQSGKRAQWSALSEPSLCHQSNRSGMASFKIKLEPRRNKNKHYTHAETTRADLLRLAAWTLATNLKRNVGPVLLIITSIYHLWKPLRFLWEIMTVQMFRCLMNNSCGVLWPCQTIAPAQYARLVYYSHSATILHHTPSQVHIPLLSTVRYIPVSVKESRWDSMRRLAAGGGVADCH